MGSFLGNIGHAITKAVKNPLQPLTHAAGKAAGITANLHNGVHVDPGKLLTDAMAFTGNPAAIAALVGNTVNAYTPTGSTIGNIGGTVGKVGGIAAGLTGGLSGLSKLPGVGALGSKLGSLPGVSSLSGLLGGSGGSGPMPAMSYDSDTGAVTGGSGSGGGGLLSSIEGMLGGGSGGGGGLLSSIGSFLTGNGGMNALGLLEGANAAQLGKKSNQFANNAVNQATSDFAAKAPLRASGIAGLLNPQTQDLSSLTASRGGLDTSTNGLQSIAGLLAPQSGQTSAALSRINARNPFAGGMA